MGGMRQAGFRVLAPGQRSDKQHLLLLLVLMNGVLWPASGTGRVVYRPADTVR